MGRWSAQRGWVDRLDHITRKTLQDDSPTGGTLIDAPTASAIVDLALKVSELALRAGSSTEEAREFGRTITDAYDLPVDIDVTWTAITISYHRAGAWEPITGFRSVRDRTANYQQLALLDEYVTEVATREVRLVKARERFRKIRSMTRPYHQWVLSLAAGGMGAMVALLLGGRWLDALLAAFAMMLLSFVQEGLNRAGIAPFYQQVAGAAVPTTIALVIMQLRASYGVLQQVSPSLVVAAGMVSLLAGLGVVSAARDALEGNLITSTARTFDTVLKTGGLVFGVIATLWIGLRLGVTGSIVPVASSAVPSWWQVLVAGIATVMFGVLSHVAPRSLLVCGALGAATYAVAFITLPFLGSQPAAASLAAFMAGVIAVFLSKVGRVPVVALIATAVVTLMPGMTLYRGLYYLILETPGIPSLAPTTLLLEAALTGVGLAAGSMLGSQLVRPLPRKWRARNSLLNSMIESTISRPSDSQQSP